MIAHRHPSPNLLTRARHQDTATRLRDIAHKRGDLVSFAADRDRRRGPSVLPGGRRAGDPAVRDIATAIAAAGSL